jgi:glutamine synthetase
VPGYEIASWERGYGDFDLRPDLGTLRRVPWLEGTALVLCDVLWHDGKPVAPSPRQVLRRQIERAEALGYTPMVGSELEFFLFRETFEEARDKHYRGLTPSVPYILDYHILASTYDESLLRRIRLEMKQAACGSRLEREAAGAARDQLPLRGSAWPPTIT